ncbi:MAG: hypothetical protein AB8B77_00125 [Alphaproteobacteria bacterium]
MGYNIKDLENAGRNVNEHFERKAQKRGEEIANRVIHTTSQGRGLWFIILWPAWLLILIFSSSFIKVAIEQILLIGEPLSWVGFLGGFAFAVAWYKWSYTIKHPFISSVIGYFGTAISVLLLSNKLGW